MTKEKEQFNNRRWLKDILTRPIKVCSGIVCESFGSSLVNVNQFMRKEFFKLSNISLNVDDMQFYFSEKDITESSLNYLKSFFKDNSIIIGYELSEQTRNIFDRIGLKYIDIWLHPIRFYDDILFAFNSNDLILREKLFKFHLDDEAFYYTADRLKIQSYKGWRRVIPELTVNSALFIGQMMNDKSVSDSGKMLSLLDFKKEFSEKTKTYSTVYYSRHPYIKTEDAEIIDYISSFKNVKVIDEAPYRLFSSIRLRHVFSISSSAAVEARYFGKDVDILYKELVRFGELGKTNSSASIYQSFLTPEFWADLFSHILDIKDFNNSGFISSKDKIRDMLGFYWSYYDIDKLENIRNQKKKMR